jgi:hypothetical protein
MAIFMLMTDDRPTDMQTDCFTPAVHARTWGTYNAVSRVSAPVPKI